MASREQPARRRKKKSFFASALIALAVLLAWLFRGCFGLGAGDGQPGEPMVDAPPPVTAPGGDAQQAPGGDASAHIATACMLELSADGLTVDGVAAEVSEAVRVCRRAGKANLQVTGGARTGTYMELTQALDQAGVPVDEGRWPGRSP